MRKLFTTIAAILLTSGLFFTQRTDAQPPEKMSYQAVIRDANNMLITNHTIGLKISILQGSSFGSPVYVEIQSVATNANGLLTIEIGGGTVIYGTFASINWTKGLYFIKTETDPTGGTNYTITITSQLLSVPYALHAKTADSIAGGIDAATKTYLDDLLAQLKLLKNTIYSGGPVNDIDGNNYNTVKIGTQVWMAENLKATRYSNGDTIGTTASAIIDISYESLPEYQWAFNGNVSNVVTYGRLYTWFAITDSRKICPTDWHIPSNTEWTTLTDYLTNNDYGYQGSGSDIAKSMAAISGWKTFTDAGTIGNDEGSNNSSGFTALPGGYRFEGGLFNYIGESGFWWSADEYNAGDANYWRMYNNSSEVSNFHNYKKDGFSVRCLKD